MRVSTIALLFIILVSASLTFTVQLGGSERSTWTVDDDGPADFASIQEAINSPQVIEDDTIYMYSGTYAENLVVNKTVSLIGEDAETTILNGGNAFDAIRITADSVCVSGLTITSADTGILLSSSRCVISGNKITSNKAYGISGSDYSSNNVFSENNITNNGYGIYFNAEEAGCWFDNNTIAQNHLSNNSVAGITFIGAYSWGSSSGNVISRNILANNTLGIKMMWGWNNTISGNDIAAIQEGIDLVTQWDSIISENTIATINGNGLSLCADWSYHGPSGCGNTVVTGNVIVVENGNGVAISGCYDNTVTGNTIAATGGGCVYLYPYRNYDYGTYWDVPSEYNLVFENSLTSINGNCIRVINCSSNNIYHNDFFAQNSPQAYTENSENSWDNGYPSGGNYWSDYNGVDLCRGVYQSFDSNDGIGDTPYIVDASNRDQYPLMQPWTPVLISTEPQTTIGKLVGETFTVDINIFNVRNLYLWQFSLVFDPAILNAAMVAQGPFLEQAGTTFFIPMIDNTQGYVLAGAFLNGPPPPEGAYGNGTLARVTFQVKSTGQTPIQFDKTWTKLRTIMMGSLVPIEHQTRDGYFSNSVISCNVDIYPDALNLKSRGKWVTAYIQLPEGYDPTDIDVSTIMLNGTVAPVLDLEYDFVTNSSEYLVDYNNDGILERMVKFNRTDVVSWIHDDLGIQYGNVTLTITGELYDGISFEGTDTIQVLFPGDADNDGDVDFNDFIIFSGCYGISIENPCSVPRADFNEDGTIDYYDSTILAGNYGKTAI